MPKNATASCLDRHQKLSITDYKAHIKEASKQGIISYFDFSLFPVGIISSAKSLVQNPVIMLIMNSPATEPE